MSQFNCKFTSKVLAYLFIDWLIENQYDFRREIHPDENIFVVECYTEPRAKAIVDWMDAHKAA